MVDRIIDVVHAWSVDGFDNISYIVEIGEERARINIVNKSSGKHISEYSTIHNKDISDVSELSRLEYHLIVNGVIDKYGN